MSRIAPEVWARLAGEQVQGETLWARQAAPEVTERLVAALDADGRRHLLILLLAKEAALQDTQSRGVEVDTRELLVPGHETGRWLDVTCQDAAGHDAFDLIGGELAERLVTENATAPEVVARVLAKWRRFWGQVPRQMLSRAELLGLFGELWFLSIWLIPKVGAGEAVARWRGPRARHDFEHPALSVEVKTTTSTRGHIHRISRIDQLSPPDKGDLMLFSLRLREEGGATNTLPGLVSSCRMQLEQQPDALSRFEATLLDSGYSPIHEEDYAACRLRVIEEGLYSVKDDFPRLTPSHFIGGMPTGVEHVEYEINLDGFANLCVAQRPHEATSL